MKQNRVLASYSTMPAANRFFIEKHKRRTAVVMSSDEYDRLRGLNIAQFSSFCAHIGQRAEASGLTEKKLKELVQ